MQEYRAYIIGPDGHIQTRFEFCCSDDEEAKDRAKQYVNGHDVELWQLDRRIAEFKATHLGRLSWRPLSWPEQIPDDRERRDQQHAHDDDAAADAVQFESRLDSR